MFVSMKVAQISIILSFLFQNLILGYILPHKRGQINVVYNTKRNRHDCWPESREVQGEC